MKTKEEVKGWLIPHYKEITQALIDRRKELNFNVYYEKFKGDNSDRMGMLCGDEYINYFYSFFNWLNIEWKHNENSGNIRFVTYEQLTYDWDEEFGANDWAADMKGFRPLDMFLESAGCVGFFVGRNDKKGLYLYKFDGETVPIHLNFEGYLILLRYTKGYSWWQNALVQLSSGRHLPNVDDFKEKMPKIFKSFNWNEFVTLYDSLRIDK